VDAGALVSRPMAKRHSGPVKDLRIANPAVITVMAVSRWQDGASGGTDLRVGGTLPDCRTQKCV